MACDAAEERHGCVMFINSDHFTLTVTWYFCLFSVFVFAGNKKRKERKKKKRSDVV
jgi:hypothetical protein